MSVNKKSKAKLGSYRKALQQLNKFRNIIVHANWLSLTKDFYVRSRIVVDPEEGSIKFKQFKITPQAIRKEIKRLELITAKLEHLSVTILDPEHWPE